ncbi:MAG TPA: glycosyltransferase family 4 protein [Nitrososphaeraceae archaeon]|nr:glycosyltransferase family 4 protein [Nitrososphaeraceae archaeon]
MNLLYFTETYYPHTMGGGEYIFYLIATELAKRGHNVSVVTNRFRNTKKEEVVDGVNVYRVGEEKDIIDREKASMRYHLTYLLQSSKKGLELIKSNRNNSNQIQIIHSNTYIPTFSGQICATISKIPHIVTFHDVYSASNNKFWKDRTNYENNKQPFYTGMIGKIIERLILKLPVNRFHTVSKASMNDLLSFGVKEEKISVIENGINPTDYSLEENLTDNKSNSLNVVYLGRLVFYKNMDTVIRAFKKVIKEIPNAKLIIVGDGPYKNQLQKESKDISSNVVFTGRIDHNEKVKEIHSSCFLVFPSLYEGFGIAIIEGFACKKPVLVSDVQPLSDIIIDDYTGYIISPLDVDAWAHKIIFLLKSEAKRNEMGENAFNDFITKYQIQETIAKLENLYASAQTFKA